VTFGGVYLLCTSIPYLTTAIRPRLLSTMWIERLYVDMNPGVEQGLQTVVSRDAGWVKNNYVWRIRFDNVGDDRNTIVLAAYGESPSVIVQHELRVPLDLPRGAADPTLFHRAGQSLFTVLVAWLGGLLGLWLYSSRDRREDPPTIPPI
jgi:hypothetical protein